MCQTAASHSGVQRPARVSPLVQTDRQVESDRGAAQTALSGSETLPRVTPLLLSEIVGPSVQPASLPPPPTSGVRSEGEGSLQTPTFSPSTRPSAPVIDNSSPVESAAKVPSKKELKAERREKQRLRRQEQAEAKKNNPPPAPYHARPERAPGRPPTPPPPAPPPQTQPAPIPPPAAPAFTREDATRGLPNRDKVLKDLNAPSSTKPRVTPTITTSNEFDKKRAINGAKFVLEEAAQDERRQLGRGQKYTDLPGRLSRAYFLLQGASSHESVDALAVKILPAVLESLGTDAPKWIEQKLPSELRPIAIRILEERGQATTGSN